MEKISIYSKHTLAACVKGGYAFLAKQLPLISKVMLPYFTVSALLLVLSAAYNIKLNVAIAAFETVTLNELLLAMLLWATAWAAGVTALGRLFLLFRRVTVTEIPTPEDVSATKTAAWQRTVRRTMQLAVRSLPYSIWPLFLNMPGFPIIGPLADFIQGLPFAYMVAAVCALAILLMQAAIFGAPLVYTFYCRMMKPTAIPGNDGAEQMKAFGFKAAYKKGFRSKGKTIALTLWSAFLAIMSCAVIVLPGLVSTEAYLSSVEGHINFNDTAFIPTAGYAMMLVVSTIAFTFCHIMWVASGATLLHLFGDIYTRGTDANPENSANN